jgi:hypothetical protein
MTPEQTRIESQILNDLIVDYWYEVDNHGGHGTSVCFTEDGIFHAGKTPIQGHHAIEEFLLRRVSRGPRTSRHIASNFRARFDGEAAATTYCVLVIYAADGTPPLPLPTPLGVFDLVDRWVKSDGKWLVADRKFVTVFTGQG